MAMAPKKTAAKKPAVKSAKTAAAKSPVKKASKAAKKSAAKRMGRPPKASEKREARLGLRLLAAERAELEAGAALFSLTVTDFVLISAREKLNRRP
jgi:hypothetical protein